MYFKNTEKPEDIKCLYFEARTSTVKRTLVPNAEFMEFGEIPVAIKKVKPVLIKL